MAWHALRRLAPWLQPRRAVAQPPAAADAQATSRGRALRAAWRMLRQRLDQRPATREVLRHLALIERALRKHGSRALQRLPVSVLQRGLEQLTLLQGDDDSPAEAAQLRVLRLRLIEVIAARTAQAGPAAMGAAAGLEVREVDAEQFDAAFRPGPENSRH
ncbi:MAG: hypothetical protein KBC73_07235 [Burkholderiaceae bacterium]|nr:hypothetical protein [Burkholderiaceae bacterium]